MNYTQQDILNACKYYKGESDNPYDNRKPEEEDMSLLWFWEEMWSRHCHEKDCGRRFYDMWAKQAEGYRTEFGLTVKPEYRDNPYFRLMMNPQVPLLRRALIEYVCQMRGKWFPYDDPTEIISYYEDKNEYKISFARKPRKCPLCGAPVYKILYGEPAMSESDYFKKYGEHVIFGGCCITENDPMWACSACKTKFWKNGRKE
jgi:hypothetical protein